MHPNSAAFQKSNSSFCKPNCTCCLPLRVSGASYISGSAQVGPLQAALYSLSPCLMMWRTWQHNERRTGSLSSFPSGHSLPWMTAHDVNWQAGSQPEGFTCNTSTESSWSPNSQSAKCHNLQLQQGRITLARLPTPCVLAGYGTQGTAC